MIEDFWSDLVSFSVGFNELSAEIITEIMLACTLGKWSLATVLNGVSNKQPKLQFLAKVSFADSLLSALDEDRSFNLIFSLDLCTLISLLDFTPICTFEPSMFGPRAFELLCEVTFWGLSSSKFKDETWLVT